LEALGRSGYQGDIAADEGTRTVYSTDNSIYQVAPAAVLFPKDGEDLNRIVRLASSSEYGPVPVTPRGGGTGTNGQSLTTGVVIDTSRYLNRILAFDPGRRLVRVEPGVVLDQLNRFLQPHGLFFPPTVSTSSRATIGGMVGTDASGKGSRIYGKTSDYIDSLDVVLSNGESFEIRYLPEAEARQIVSRADLVGRIHREVQRVVAENRALIATTFPDMNRGLTGYNLKNAAATDGSLSLAYLLSGSEGTLALTKSITLRVIPRPAHRALVVIRYADFGTALEDVSRLLKAKPAAVEILDDKVLAVAQQDVIWSDIEHTLGGSKAAVTKGLNFVEFVDDTAHELDGQLSRFRHILDEENSEVALDWSVVTDQRTISQLWELRKKAVGLLGRLGGNRQGTPFVEDTAVPPENLPEYIREFRALLDRYDLAYGMFGHADVGCLHVRPALNMVDPVDAALIRPISDEVARLTRKYGGLLWGEHGRGYRGEYSPFFFGPELYAELCSLKAVFDPQNIFNPGKLAKPSSAFAIDRIDAVPLRGEFDRTISAKRSSDVDRAIACNGNGACFSWDVSEPMCPSYKATGDRRQSPKGRAAMLREWARLESISGHNTEAIRRLHAFEDEVQAALSTCLSCKACSSQCPIKVDIPTMKARFLEHYRRRVPRPLRDHLVARMESLLAIARIFPRLANGLLHNRVTAKVLARVFGLVDLPEVSSKHFITSSSAHVGVEGSQAHNIVAGEGERTVILLQDTFTSTFDTDVVQAIHDLLEKLGYRVRLAAPRPNGKALHNLGMLAAFERVGTEAKRYYAALVATGFPVIGIEPVTVLMHDHEYKSLDVTSARAVPSIHTVEQFLVEEIEAGRLRLPKHDQESRYQLFLHCTEKTGRPKTGALWRTVFAAFGLEVETPATGCCGMAGMFGHEREHAGMSRELFELSWRPHIESTDTSAVLATGFSCRCQTKRYGGFRPRHPAEALLEHIRAPEAYIKYPLRNRPQKLPLAS
jgi:FAD/FMN-containing dehydrogenase/Fe-S oxidoreductase